MRLFILTMALLSGVLHPVFAQESKPWEVAAKNGLLAMNRGDGEAFVIITHPEFLEMMKFVCALSLKSEPHSATTKQMLKEFGVSSIAEFEKLPLKKVSTHFIKGLHTSQPPAYQNAAKNATVEVLQSNLIDDMYHVEVIMTVSVGGLDRKNMTTLLAKKDGDVWKYNGDAKMVKGLKKQMAQ